MSNKKSRYGAIVDDVEAVIDSNAVSRDRLVKIGGLALGVFSLGICALGTWDFNLAEHLIKTDLKIPFTLSSSSSSNTVTLKDVVDAYAFFEFSEPDLDSSLTNMIVSWTPENGWEGYVLGKTLDGVTEASQTQRYPGRIHNVLEFSKASLPKYFPERFFESSKPFRFHVGMNDYTALECANPYTGVRCADMPKGTFFAGTIPNEYKTLLPKLRPFPNMALLDCFTTFVSNGPVCDWFTVKPESECELSEDSWGTVHHPGAEGLMLWDKDFSSLKNKLVWRGSDYGMMHFFQECERGCSAEDFLKQEMKKGNISPQDDAASIIEKKGSASIPPRLFAALLSQAHPDLIDVKFVMKGAEDFQELENLHPGLATVDGMTKCEIASHRYQIDLGGNGGTTWTGTIDKLAMPGLLFHHSTPMMDSYFGSLNAGEHYVAIKEDLSDLKEKIEYYEINLQEAEKIAKAGQAWVRHFISEAGQADAIRSEFVNQMKDYVQDYDDNNSLTFEEAVKDLSNGSLIATKISKSLTDAGAEFFFV